MNFIPRGKSQPMSAAERQRICRAKKKGTYQAGGIEVGSIPGHLLPGSPESEAALRELYESKGLSHLLGPKTKPELPAPQTNEIQKSASAEKTTAIESSGVDPTADQLLASLPPAVAKRLRSLVIKHQSGKSLTEDELAEAKGLLDIAEYFSIQRMRKQLAA